VVSAEGTLELQAFRPAAAGEQVFLSYGWEPNHRLLTFYGFALPDNPHDAVMMSVELPGGGGAAARQRELLDLLGLGGEDHELRRGVFPHRLAQTLEVLLCQDPEETARATKRALLSRAAGAAPNPTRTLAAGGDYSPATLAQLASLLETVAAQYACPPGPPRRPDAPAADGWGGFEGLPGEEAWQVYFARVARASYRDVVDDVLGRVRARASG